jgi:S-formylglutathione hydrolase FrmB
MRQLLPAVTLTVAAAMCGLDAGAASNGVSVDGTAMPPSPSGRMRPATPTAQRGTKPPTAAHLVTPAARLRDERVTSPAIGRTIDYRVLLPEHYGDGLQRFPVLYLLHGLSGDYKDWTTRTNVADYTRRLPLIVVMPDGENSWYTNSVGEPALKFEDYWDARVRSLLDIVTKRLGRQP